MNDNKKTLDITNFGPNLYRLRTAKKYTVEYFAEMLNVSSRIVYDWESSKKCPTFENAINIAIVLEVSLDSILY